MSEEEFKDLDERKGTLDESHIAHTAINVMTDKEFLKLLKEGRLVVEDVVERWMRSGSECAIVAAGSCRSKIKNMEGKRYLLLQIELEEESKPFNLIEKNDSKK